MKRLLFLTASAFVAGGLTSCAPAAPPVTKMALDCPASRGELTRTSISPDKKTCLYTSRNGDEVSLRLVSFTGDVEQALKPIQAELDAEMAPAAADAKPDSKARAKVGTEDNKAALADSERAAKEASTDAKGHDEDDDGNSHDKDDHAQVDLPGIHISASDDGKADVNVGPIHINANDDSAVVHVSHDVRMRGEPFTRERRGYRSTYIVASNRLKDGYTAVGYEVSGPRAGPVAVAVVKSRNGSHHQLPHDVESLVRHNGGA